jgi:hypothetical protein
VPENVAVRVAIAKRIGSATLRRFGKGASQWRGAIAGSAENVDTVAHGNLLYTFTLTISANNDADAHEDDPQGWQMSQISTSGRTPALES